MDAFVSGGNKAWLICLQHIFQHEHIFQANNLSHGNLKQYMELSLHLNVYILPTNSIVFRWLSIQNKHLNWIMSVDQAILQDEQDLLCNWTSFQEL